MSHSSSSDSSVASSSGASSGPKRRRNKANKSSGSSKNGKKKVQVSDSNDSGSGVELPKAKTIAWDSEASSDWTGEGERPRTRSELAVEFFTKIDHEDRGYVTVEEVESALAILAESDVDAEPALDVARAAAGHSSDSHIRLTDFLQEWNADTDKGDDVHTALTEHSTIGEAEIGYKLVVGATPVFLINLLQTVPFALQSSTFAGQPLTGGVRKYQWTIWLNVAFYLIYAVAFLFPSNFAKLRRTFWDWGRHALINMFVIQPGILLGVIIVMTVSNNYNIPNDSFYFSNATVVFYVWIGTAVFCALPSSKEISREGEIALARERLELQQIQVASSYARERTAWDYVVAIHKRRPGYGIEDDKERYSKVQTGGDFGFNAVAGALSGIAAGTWALWLRPFALYDGEVLVSPIEPTHWILFVLLGVMPAHIVSVLFDNFILWTNVSFKLLTQNIKDLSLCINAQTAATHHLPYIPTFQGNNDYAYARIRQYFTKYDECVMQARAHLKMKMFMNLTVLLVILVVVFYIAKVWDQFAFMAFWALFFSIVASTLFITGLLVNEALSGNLEALAAEIFYTQTRMDDKTSITTEQIVNANKLKDFLVGHAKPLTIAGIPVTRTSLAAVRAGLASFAVVAYGLINSVILELQEERA